jgi:large subunit ribosomal protein L19
MVNLIQEFEKEQANKINEARGGLDKFVPNFKVGDSVKVKYKITEGTTTRLQAFAGIVIARSKSFSNYSATFTVRKISDGIGVERKFTLYSPLISNIELVKQGVVRRAKLYYLRNLTGKASRIKEKMDFLIDAKSEESKK